MDYGADRDRGTTRSARCSRGPGIRPQVAGLLAVDPARRIPCLSHICSKIFRAVLRTSSFRSWAYGRHSSQPEASFDHVSPKGALFLGTGSTSPRKQQMQDNGQCEKKARKEANAKCHSANMWHFYMRTLNQMTELLLTSHPCTCCAPVSCVSIILVEECS